MHWQWLFSSCLNKLKTRDIVIQSNVSTILLGNLFSHRPYWHWITKYKLRYVTIKMHQLLCYMKLHGYFSIFDTLHVLYFTETRMDRLNTGLVTYTRTRTYREYIERFIHVYVSVDIYV